VWLSLLTASVLISFTPGAGAINTMTNALNEGFRRAIWGIVGQQIALVAHVLIVAAGVGLIVANSPALFDAIRYAGAAYLVYLGARMFLARPADLAVAPPPPHRSAHGNPPPPAPARAHRAADDAPARAHVTGDDAQVAGDAAPAAAVVGLSREGEPAWSMVRRGIWVNLLNPKAIVFFLAFTPQFIRPDAPLLPQYAVFIATIVVVDILVMWFFFAAAARGFQRFTATPRGQRVLNHVFGGLFIAVAVVLLFVD